MKFLKISITIIFVLIFLPINSIKAASISSVKDQLGSINSGAITSHTIYFIPASSVTSGQTLVINVPSFIFGASYNFNDISLQQGNSSNCSIAIFTAKTLAASPLGTTWGAVYSLNNIIFTSGTDTLNSNVCIKVVLNSNGSGHTLTNPTVSSNTTYNVALTQSNGDIGESAVVILDNNGSSSPKGSEVSLSIDVATVINFDIDVVGTNCLNSTETSSSNNKIDFGYLNLGTALYSGGSIPYICMDAGTNSATGMKILAQSSRNNVIGGLVSGSDVIQAVTADLNNVLTDSGYGLRVVTVGVPQIGSFTSQAPFNSATAGSVGQFSGLLAAPSVVVVSNAAAKTASANRIQVETGVKAGNTTSSGNYSDVITFTAITNL